MNNQTMKILLTTGIFPPEVGGPATYSFLMEKELPKQGIDVVVLPFRTVRHLPRWIRHFVFFCKVLAHGRKVDLLYSQDPLSVGFPTLIAAKFLRKPFMVRIAGDYAWEQSVQRYGVNDSIDEFQTKTYSGQIELMRNLQRFTARYADRVINPSIYFRDLVRGWVKDKEKVIHIYNGIDLKSTPKTTYTRETKTIISAGRLLPWKGFDILIQILPLLPGWKLYIAGDGPELNTLTELARKNGVTDRTIFLGSIPRAELLQKLQQYEIFVLNTSFESFSFQVVEAMYSGIPVITTNIGNLSEIVENGKEGMLVTPNDRQELLSSIQKFHEDHSFRDIVVTNALKKSEIFSIESTLEKTAKVMREVLKK